MARRADERWNAKSIEDHGWEEDQEVDCIHARWYDFTKLTAEIKRLKTNNKDDLYGVKTDTKR